ncbi:hypothetical protein POL68_24160 [Stigmatella sp. ncwal1]|uniref:Histidine kinase/HSP90-like ATPase domain-containing protein n=1 Tax=Stigmatella ashevillensis TaxID=2995309 RepID=A0ABT5DGU9_9BACT|nr:hypothetical protein [Stigmatella ashevillena]MDC0711586.1 hypothetical protein [Stigmatella ashevillena]
MERLRRKAPGAAVSEDVDLDLRNCHYLGPAAVVTLCALRAKADLAAKSFRIALPESPPPLTNYCRYSGLQRFFGLGPGPDAHPDNVTTPVRQFRTRPLSELAEISSLVRRQMGLSKSDEHYLNLTLIELAQNVLDHAKSQVGGFLSARALSTERQVRFAVADLGIGFREALRLTHPVHRDLDAIRLAMTANVSSKSSTHNLGQGLKLLRDIVLANGGSMLLCSKGAWFELLNGRENVGVFLNGNEYPGVLAVVTLPVRGPGADEDKDDHGDVWD